MQKKNTSPQCGVCGTDHISDQFGFCHNFQKKKSKEGNWSNHTNWQKNTSNQTTKYFQARVPHGCDYLICRDIRVLDTNI